jgi:hypothetical protein
MAKSVEEKMVSKLHKWICRYVSEYMLERAKEMEAGEDVFNGDNKGEFSTFQLTCLKTKTKLELKRLVHLTALIDAGMNLMDEDSMCQFSAEGFFFNKEGKLTVFNPR